MKFYKAIEDGYIVAIGINIGGVEIEKSEYEQLMDIIRNKPAAADGYDYRLSVAIEWDKYHVFVEPSEE